MTDTERSLAGKTVAHTSLEDLITPKLEPGKACLVVIRGRSVGRLYELTAGPAVLGRATEVELPLEDTAVSRRHARIEPSPEGYVITDLKSTNGVFVNGVRVERHLLKDKDRVQIGTTTILKFCYQDEMETTVQKSLYDSATRDPLSGCYNRKFFVDTLELDFSYCLRNDTPLSLLMIDIDFFKRVNDTYGHLAGDQVLRETGPLLQRDLRTEDILSRYGGEEFALLLRYTDKHRALAIAERLRKTYEAHPFGYGDHRFQLTLSVGVSTLAGANYKSAEELLSAADAFLYQAKQQGRNLTVAKEPDPTVSFGETLNLAPGEVDGLARQPAEGEVFAPESRAHRPTPPGIPTARHKKAGKKRRRK